MQLKWNAPLIGVFGLVMSLCSATALAAESSALLSHSLQDDYSNTVTAQQQSVMSLAKLQSADGHKNYDLSWDLSMREWMYQNSLNKENLFIMRAGLDMTYHMTRALSVNLAPAFSYFNGFFRSG